ncbi:MAG: hypothetical protein WCI77_02290 [Candidatus Omnitrophota bacterium]
MRKKIYASRREKIIDFFLGCALSFALSALSAAPMVLGIFMKSSLSMANSSVVSIVISSVTFLATMAVVIYLCLRRLYMGIGLLFGLVGIPLILLGTCFLIFSGASIFGPLFKR